MTLPTLSSLPTYGSVALPWPCAHWWRAFSTAWNTRRCIGHSPATAYGNSRPDSGNVCTISLLPLSRPRWLPLDALDAIPTRTFPDRLQSVIDGWDVTRRLPVFLMDNGQTLELLNGNHRLTAARAKGMPTIYATVMPYCPEYLAARQRERDTLAELKALDGIPNWVDQDNNLRNSLR